MLAIYAARERRELYAQGQRPRRTPTNRTLPPVRSEQAVRTVYVLSRLRFAFASQPDPEAPRRKEDGDRTLLEHDGTS
jgi:hypothetical protein